jgi:hypothetical protein
MSAAHSYLRTHLVAVAAGAALIAAVLIAGGLTAALIGHVPVPAVIRGDDGGAVPLADARRAPRGSLHHGPVARPRAVAAHRSAPTVANGPVQPPVRAQQPVKPTHTRQRTPTRTRTSLAPVATPAPVIASTPPARAPARPTSPPAPTRHDNGRHLGQTRTSHDSGRHLGQLRKSTPRAAPSPPATRRHGNPHGRPPGHAAKSHPPPGHARAAAAAPPAHTPGAGAANGHGHGR